MFRKIVISLSKICFYTFCTILIGFFISQAVAGNIIDYIDFIGLEDFNRQISEFFNIMN